VSLASSDLELMEDRSPQEGVGLRFGGLEIPPGATVVNAYVQFQANEAQSEPTELTIQGQASDDVPSFSVSLSNDISARPRTAAAVQWVPAAWTAFGGMGSAERTPDLAPVIQEIVSRPGWKSGHSLAILIGGIGHRTATSYDGDMAGAPLLHVEVAEAGVVAGAGGGPTAPPPPDSTRDRTVVVSIAPNPLRDRGALHFTTQRAGPVRIQLYDVSGRRVRTLEDSSNIPAGSHRTELSTRDSDGERLPAGVLFYRVEAAGATSTGRFLILN
jgi:hypothetical protein